MNRAGGFTGKKGRDTLMRRLIPTDPRMLWIMCLAFALLPIALPAALLDGVGGRGRKEKHP